MLHYFAHFLVLDTDNTELLKKCGTGIPDSRWISMGNTLTVNFVTDNSIGKKVRKSYQMSVAMIVLMIISGI